MNNFKKFAAVLLGVVMACVFATSAFAADFNKSNNAKRAKDEILSFAASYGVTTIDNTVNKLTVALQKKRKNVAVKMKKERRLRSCLNTS